MRDFILALLDIFCFGVFALMILYALPQIAIPTILILMLIFAIYAAVRR